MSLSDKMNEFAVNVQESVKNNSLSTINLLLKLFTAFVLGLTLALIGQELFHYAIIVFLMIMLASMSFVFSIIYKWTLGFVFIFDLICVLVALLLRMYLLMAP